MPTTATIATPMVAIAASIAFLMLMAAVIVLFALI